MSRHKKLFTVATFAFATIFAAMITAQVSASTVQEMTNDMTNKMYYTALKNCFSTNTRGEITTDEFSNWSKLFYNSAGDQHFPDGWSTGNSLSCGTILSRVAGEIPSDLAQRGLLLSELGYTKKEGQAEYSKRKCLTVNFTERQQDSGSDASTELGDYSTPEICFYLDESDTIKKADFNQGVKYLGGSPIRIDIETDPIIIEDNYAGSSSYGDKKYINYLNQPFSSFAAAYTVALNSFNLTVFPSDPSQPTRWYEIERNASGTLVYHTTTKPTNEANATGTYTRPEANASAIFNNIASKYLQTTSGVFSASERVSLYQFYLKNNAQSVCDPEDGWQPGASFQQVRLVIDGQYYNNCYSSGPANKEFAGFNNQGEFDYNTKINFSNIISELNSTTASDLDGVIDPGATRGSVGGELITPDPDDSNNSGSNNDTSDTDICYGSEGTLGLSWIICPIVRAVYETLNWIYTDIVEQFLPIDGVNFFATDNEVYTAWQRFQTFANIIVVILLLVVIFSQLTGIGIDNYGIKKILPRLIIVAILINLSYFIAQFLVDVSNIVGSAIGGIFGTINVPHVSSDGGAVVTVLGVGASLGLIAGAFALFNNPITILSFLITCISGLVSVVMMWAILITRQVGVILAVIVSPIVFACYLLPNTSKVTKSWVNLMKGLLLLYPLCALLVGGSAFVSDLFKSVSDSQVMFLAAILIRVLPFFALPSLFRKSISAMGSLGATIQGFGRNLSRGVTSGIRGTEGYKALQKSSLERQNRRRAGLDREGNLTNRGERRTRRAGSRVGRFFGMDSLQASRIARANKSREEDISSAAQLGEAVERRELARNEDMNRRDYLKDQLINALSSGSTSDYFAAVDQATKSGMKSSDIAKITREVFKGDHWGGSLANEGQRGNFLQEFANRYGGSFLKKDAEQKSWAATRAGLDTPAGIHSIEGFAAAGGMETADLKDNEIIDLSAERLYELLEAGIIDRAQAQRVWSSGANMDSVNKLMLGALGTRGELVKKDEAQRMTSKNYAGGMHGLDRQAVQALTEATPQDTVIRDVRWKNENGEHEQTDPLIVQQAQQANPNAPRIDMPDGTYYQNGTHYDSNGQPIP